MNMNMNMNVGNAIKHVELNFTRFDADKDGWLSMGELRQVADKPGDSFSSKKDTLAARTLMRNPDVLQQADKTNFFQSRDGYITQGSLRSVGDNYKTSGVDFSAAAPNYTNNDGDATSASQGSQYGGSGGGMSSIMEMMNKMMRGFMEMLSSVMGNMFQGRT